MHITKAVGLNKFFRTMYTKQHNCICMQIEKYKVEMSVLGSWATGFPMSTCSTWHLKTLLNM